jgi:hypothetical protein
VPALLAHATSHGGPTGRFSPDDNLLGRRSPVMSGAAETAHGLSLRSRGAARFGRRARPEAAGSGASSR